MLARCEQGSGSRAGDRTRTGDVQLGKLAFYQLNYARSAGRADKRNISGPREAATPPALPYCRTGARGAAKGCGNIDAKPPRSAHRLSTGAPFRYEPSLHNIVAPCGGPEIARAGVALAAAAGVTLGAGGAGIGNGGGVCAGVIGVNIDVTCSDSDGALGRCIGSTTGAVAAGDARTDVCRGAMRAGADVLPDSGNRGITASVGGGGGAAGVAGCCARNVADAISTPLAAPPSRRRRWTRVIGQSANWCMSRSSRS